MEKQYPGCLGPFQIDPICGYLWRGERQISLRPKPLAVLRYFIEQSGRILTRDELVEQLWPGLYVTRTVLRVCMREIREALGDNADDPQFIETVGRQGYRFIAPLIVSWLVYRGV